MSNDNNQVGQIVRTETGYKFTYSRKVTHKQMNEATKRIENEYTIEAGLSGNEETYDHALAGLLRARDDVDAQVAINGA